VKSLKYFVLAALLTLVSFVPQAKATCTFHPSYSTYVSQVFPTAPTYNTNGQYSIQQLVHITGSTTVDDVCKQMMYSATHNPFITNKLGTYGGTFNGPAVGAFSQTDWTSSITGTFSVGTQYTSQNISGGMHCSVAGNFWNWTYGYFTFEIAYTLAQNTNVVIGHGTFNDVPTTIYKIIPYCSAYTTPPDYFPYSYSVPSTVPPSSVEFVHTVDVCTRFINSPWVCSTYFPGVSLPSWGFPGPAAPGNCTHNP